MCANNVSFVRKTTKSSDLYQILKDFELDWRVVRVPVISEPEIGTFGNISFSENIGIVRENNQYPLSVMGDNYLEIQNWDALKIFEPLVESKEITIQEGGYFKFGKRAWVSAKLREITIEKFRISNNIMLVWSHNGDVALALIPDSRLLVPDLKEPIYLVSYLPGPPEMFGQFTVKHTKYATKRMELAYPKAIEFLKKIGTFYTGLENSPFKLNEMEKLLEYLYPNPEKKRIRKDGTVIVSYNEKKRNAILAICEDFKKNQLFSDNKFLYATAFNYYYDYKSRVRITQDTIEEEQRLMSTWFGTAYKEKVRFLKNISNYEKMVVQGEIK